MRTPVNSKATSPLSRASHAHPTRQDGRPVTALLAVAALCLLAFFGAACGSDHEQELTPARVGESPEQTDAAADISALARSVVQVFSLDENEEPVWWGSGTVISDDGLILTNAHVVDDRNGEYDSLAIAVINSPDEPTEPRWYAEIAAVDYALDLAVIRPVSDLDGAPPVIDIPSLPLGNSDAVEIGNPIHILGFPAIGGETITYTEGVVSGFTAQKDIPERAWIKTDSTIAGGNSGGLAASARGELIGVPTTVGSGREDAPVVDCRSYGDTNQDGNVDEEDDCLVVGGFINGLRPVNLALPLIEAVEDERAYVSPYVAPEPPPPVGGGTPGPFPDPQGKEFENLIFADGITGDGKPGNIITELPAGATELYAFWDFSGIAGLTPNVTWDALWLKEDELVPEASTVAETWFYGRSGQAWVAIIKEDGLKEGEYELVLAVDGETLASASITVGSE